MSTASGTQLKAYWQSQCDGEQPPFRADMQPVDMKSFLPDLMILEVLDDCGFLVRLAGTRVVRRFGSEPTSKVIRTECRGVIGGIASLAETCHAEKGPVSGCIPYLDGVESFDAVNCVVLPLRDKHGEIRQFILALDFEFAATSILRSAPSVSRI